MSAIQDNPLLEKLLPNERLLWTGQPDSSAYKKRTVNVMLGISGFSILGIALLTLCLKGTTFFTEALSSLILVSVLAAFVIPLVLYAGSGAQNHHYGISNRRLLKIYPGESGDLFRWLDLSQVRKVQVKKRKNDTGTLVCISKAKIVLEHIEFECIDDVEEVCKIIQVALSDAAPEMLTPFKPGAQND